jgi:thiamine monophosphate synthase
MHLLAITPGEGFDPSHWEPVLASGIDALLIREPGLEAAALRAAALWCRDRHPEVALWVRGLAVEGCGLHLPEGALGDAPSRPLHDEAQWEARRGAAQLLVSPIFDAPGKGPAWGVARLHRFLDARPEGGPRLLALGGVTPENVGSLRHPRLAGLAAIRPFWSGAPAAAVTAFRSAWS